MDCGVLGGRRREGQRQKEMSVALSTPLSKCIFHKTTHVMHTSFVSIDMRVGEESSQHFSAVTYIKGESSLLLLSGKSTLTQSLIH